MYAILEMRGSEGETYHVYFLYRAAGVYLACTCRAGAFGKLCRHKLALLRGDPTALQDQIQKPLLQEIRTCLDQSPVIALCDDLQDVEERLDLLQQETKVLKAAIELQVTNIRPNAKIWKTLQNP